MKETITLLSLLLITCSWGMAQESMIYTHVDQMPYFPACDEYDNGSDEKRQCSNQSLVTYLAENLRYPETAKEEEVEGTVLVSFVIDENGLVLEPYLIRDIGGGCGEVALKIIRDMPTWEPGIHDGKRVNVKLNLPIQFTFKDQAGDQAKLFTINWGKLKGSKVTKKELIENFEYPVIIRNQYGTEVSVTELIFTFERKRAFHERQSTGAITPELRKILKKVKKGGVFTLSAAVQQKGKFIFVRKTYSITD